MKRTLLMLILSCISLTAAAQTATDAFAKYEAKEYRASGEMYDKVLKAGNGTASDYYNAACSWALAGNKNKAFAHLEQAVAKGYTSVKHMQQDSDLSSLHADKRWPKLVEDLKKSVAAIETSYNQPLKNELESIYETDQQIRREFLAAREKHGMESVEVKALGHKMEQIDKENQEKVVAIIEQHGWPGKSMVGMQASTAAFLVIQHAPQEIMEKYLPLMRMAAAKGEASNNHLAMMEDRVRMNKGLPQLYGSQVQMNPETKQWELYKVEDESNLDKRRAEVGLGPIKEYLKRMGVEYTPPSGESVK
ncbi:DUF6624 domain-containing protein [Pontibacter locisalis]|uniref:DUF6624 domain-containing protein n=1 Tax=Pontibacter locisalis TaxID=1719035 RepID=A0ABW5IJ05_9BACT